jgi:hypothetical protein
MKLVLTHRIAMAAAQDAGDRSMRKAGRTVWAVKDYRAACDEFERIYGYKHAPVEDSEGDV